MKIKRRGKLIGKNVTVPANSNATRNVLNECTRQQRKIIYEALRARLPVARAAALAGVSKLTFDRWVRAGIEFPKTRYGRFRKKYYEIRSKNEKESLAIIEKMGRGGFKTKEVSITIGGKYGKEVTRKTKMVLPQWTAAAWYLERMYPDDYGLKKREDNVVKDPGEFAREIKDALDAIDESIPNLTEEDEEDE